MPLTTHFLFYFHIKIIPNPMIKNASIRVGIKIKPSDQATSVVSVNKEGTQLIIKMPGDDVKHVQVDMIHDAATTKESIYKNCQIHSLIGKFVEGYNTAILTYGQTGSGKTFAFQGDAQNQGIVFAAISDIYAHKTSSALIKCSFIQIYNQKISDMFNSDLNNDKGLRMRWQIQREFIIQDLSEKECQSAEEMMKAWNLGNKNRVVACNKIHDYSSRSHSIFIVTMEDKDELGNYRVRSAHFVDLAGSERVFSPVGRLSKQAIEINKSLFFLRKVIISLQETANSGKEQYIPYRDSKLTSILKKSFGGNCLTYLIACLNPHQDYLEETLSTLQYAVSAGKIKNQVNINIDLKAREIQELKMDKEKLKKELELALLQIEMFKSIEREEEMKRASNHQYANRIIECIGTVRELLKSNKQLRAELDKEKAEKRALGLDLQQCEKKLKQAKRMNELSPIKESQQRKRRTSNTFGQTKGKLGFNQTPKKSFMKTESIASPDVIMSDRPTYSQSVDLFRKKQKGRTTIHRKKYEFYDPSEATLKFK